MNVLTEAIIEESERTNHEDSTVLLFSEDCDWGACCLGMEYYTLRRLLSIVVQPNNGVTLITVTAKDAYKPIRNDSMCPACIITR